MCINIKEESNMAGLMRSIDTVNRMRRQREDFSGLVDSKYDNPCFWATVQYIY